MSTNVNQQKEAPPSYTEAMQMPPQVGIFPNANVTIGITNPEPTAPPVSLLQTGYVTSYGSFESPPVSVIVQPQVVAVSPDIITIRGCPACRIGVLEDSFSCLGLLCAILFFPVGIICCLLLKTKRCSNCGTEF